MWFLYKKYIIVLVIILILIIGGYFGYKKYFQKIQISPDAPIAGIRLEKEKTLLESLPTPAVTDENQFYKQNKDLLDSLPPPLVKDDTQAKSDVEKLLNSLPPPPTK